MNLPALTDAIAQRCYLHGYKQRWVPKLARRMLARSYFHRAWLLGRCCYFIEDDVRYGLCRPYGSPPKEPMGAHEYTEEDMDRMDAAEDFDIEMHIQEALTAAVDGLDASTLRYGVMDEFVALVRHGFAEDDAAECLRFLMAAAAAHTWEDGLMRIALPLRRVSFGPDRPHRVVASVVAYWEDLR